MRRLSRAIGSTEGEVWTLALGLLLAVVVLAFGVVPVLEHHVARAGANALQALGGEPVADAPPTSAASAPSGSAPSAGPAPPVASAAPAVSPATASSVSPPLPAADDTLGLAVTPIPLTIIGFGWATDMPASSEAATAGGAINTVYEASSLLPVASPVAFPPDPLPDPTVPATGLPVALRLGSVSKFSYVKLTGDESVLHLQLISGDAATQENAAQAAISVCPILKAGWAPDVATPMANAPAYDCGRGTSLRRDADGTWSADLTRFADRTTGPGFALVPTGGAATTYQVVFAS